MTKKKQNAIKTESIGLHIGASEAGIAAARDAILQILDRDKEPTVLVAALDCLKTLCHVGNTNVSNCHFNVK